MRYFLTKIIKKTLLITLFLTLILLSLNCIHAGNSTDIQDSVNDTNVKTYLDLSDKVNENPDSLSVELNESYTFNGNNDSEYIDGIIISRNLTITGDDGVYIDGNHTARALCIEPNCNVTLKNLIFKNGFSESDGGAILLKSNSSLTLFNCTFINNKVYNSNGGAIANYKNSTLSVYDSIFSNNTSIRVSDLEWKEFKDRKSVV